MDVTQAIEVANITKTEMEFEDSDLLNDISYL